MEVVASYITAGPLSHNENSNSITQNNSKFSMNLHIVPSCFRVIYAYIAEGGQSS